MTMKEIKASQFRVHCLQLMDEIAANGETITKNGRPVAKLVRSRTNPLPCSGLMPARSR